jgi:psiF repeat
LGILRNLNPTRGVGAGLAKGSNQRREVDLKTIVIAIAIAGFFTAAFAQAPATCNGQAAEKKLSGAAMTSFMKKCESDAAAQCGADSTAKKLAGAAKTAHEKKCVGDAVGT